VRIKLVVSITSAVLAVTSFSQTRPSEGIQTPKPRDIRVVFPDGTPKKLWITEALPAGEPEGAITTRSPEAIVPIKSHSPKNLLCVLDLKTSNLAVKRVAELSSVWEMSDKDYQYIFSVLIKVVHEGEGVANAIVTLKTPGRKQTAIVSKEDLGMLRFFTVRPGEAELLVSYKYQGATKSLPAESTNLSLERTDGEPILTSVVNDPVETSSVPNIRKMRFKLDDRIATGRAERPSSPVGTVLVYAGAVALAVFLLFGILKLFQRNADAAKAQLQKFGVAVPEDLSAHDAVGDQASTAPQREPIVPIVLGTAAVDAIFSESMPKLVGEKGTIEIGHQDLIIGRDSNLGIAIDGESTVSRRHAKLEWRSGQPFVTDLGSTNGTFVNGMQIQSETPLRAGDAVQFGAVRFVFEA